MLENILVIVVLQFVFFLFYVASKADGDKVVIEFTLFGHIACHVLFIGGAILFYTFIGLAKGIKKLFIKDVR